MLFLVGLAWVSKKAHIRHKSQDGGCGWCWLPKRLPYSATCPWLCAWDRQAQAGRLLWAGELSRQPADSITSHLHGDDTMQPDLHRTRDGGTKVLVNPRSTSSRWTTENMALQCIHRMSHDLSLLQHFSPCLKFMWRHSYCHYQALEHY